MTTRRPVDVMIFRGGTSRGPVLRLDAAPPAGPDRDAFARALVAGCGNTADGLGGGSAVTNKIVLVGPAEQDAVGLDYIVGNVAPAGDAVDWSGTCGNMTSAVVPYAAASGLLPPGHEQPVRLRNLATARHVDVTVHDGAQLADPDDEVRLTTTHLDPGGAVLGATLPTGAPRDVLDVDGEQVDATVVDVTHPYLFVRYEQVVGDADPTDPAVAERLERIRGTACVRLGLVTDADTARWSSAAVPRMVLVHAEPGPDADLRITAVSMGQAIATVPVTAGLSLAAASRISGSLVATAPRTGDPGAAVRVAAPAARLCATAAVDADGRVTSASVERTARCLVRGTAWV